jgi:DNA-directed RNA polymerase sigma subunit (sigma70/sigma32)
MLVDMTADDEHLAEYLNEVGGLHRLSSDDEREELVRAREGDQVARRRVIEGNLEVTAHLALRLAPDWMRPLDAIQEANLVLVRLVDDGSSGRPADRLSDDLVRHFAEVTRRLGP